MTRIILKIYVADLRGRNAELIATFRQVCQDRLNEKQYQLLVIDILKNTAEAEQKKILACPTIIREKPLPEKRIIGDFRETDKSLMALDFLIEDIH